MGLTTCPDCKNKVSTKAVACPKCGLPIRNAFQLETKATDKSFDEFVKRSENENKKNRCYTIAFQTIALLICLSIVFVLLGEYFVNIGKTEAEIIKSRTPEWFIDTCKDNPNYIGDCFGREITWYGRVNHIGFNSVNVDVLGDKGAPLKTSNLVSANSGLPPNPFGSILKIDSKSLKRDWVVKKNQLIEFHGKIDQENYFTPDIEEITYVRVVSAENQKKRITGPVETIAPQEQRIEQLNRHVTSSKFNWQELDFTIAINSSGNTCSKVTYKKLSHESKGERFISVLCADGGSFMVFLPNKITDKTKVMECGFQESITGIKCFKDYKEVAQVNTESYSANHEKVEKLFQSNEEKAAKDATWTARDIFKVGVFDNGSNRDGYASYVCLTLYDYGFKGEKIWVQIIDLVKLTKNDKWVRLGEARCR